MVILLTFGFACFPIHYVPGYWHKSSHFPCIQYAAKKCQQRFPSSCTLNCAQNMMSAKLLTLCRRTTVGDLKEAAKICKQLKAKAKG